MLNQERPSSTRRTAALARDGSVPLLPDEQNVNTLPVFSQSSRNKSSLQRSRPGSAGAVIRGSSIEGQTSNYHDSNDRAISSPSLSRYYHGSHAHDHRTQQHHKTGLGKSAAESPFESTSSSSRGFAGTSSSRTGSKSGLKDHVSVATRSTFSAIQHRQPKHPVHISGSPNTHLLANEPWYGSSPTASPTHDMAKPGFDKRIGTLAADEKNFRSRWYGAWANEHNTIKAAAAEMNSQTKGKNVEILKVIQKQRMRRLNEAKKDMLGGDRGSITESDGLGEIREKYGIVD